MSARCCKDWPNHTSFSFPAVTVLSLLKDGQTFSNLLNAHTSTPLFLLYQWSHGHFQTLLDPSHKILVVCIWTPFTGLCPPHTVPHNRSHLNFYPIVSHHCQPPHCCVVSRHSIAVSGCNCSSSSIPCVSWHCCCRHSQHSERSRVLISKVAAGPLLLQVCLQRGACPEWLLHWV